MVANILSVVQAATTFGFAFQAGLLGTSYYWYPQGVGQSSNPSNNPLSSANQRGTYLCLFDRDSKFSAKLAAEYGKPEYFVAYNRTGPKVGDYFSNGTDTYFIIDQKVETPSKCVLCNATASFYRPGAAAPIEGNSTDPAADYSDYVSSNTANAGDGLPLGMNWPISLLTGSRGEKDVTNLPLSGRQPWVNVLCPAIPGVRLVSDDQFIDDVGNRYQISAAELTPLGYRITAQLAES